MDKRRAQEIATSREMANVTYNEDQIYIESINESKNTASIHFLDNPGVSKEVSLSSLIEH